jgi:thiamine pyrophosphate-dependent acetolactate synthase large subunit-like protein
MSNKETLTGAEALIRSLEMENVEIMFGLPGGCILPAYDPLLKSSIRHILVRHEQGAGHMAQGYAHVTGRPGVAMVTSGPAATNMVTPLASLAALQSTTNSSCIQMTFRWLFVKHFILQQQVVLVPF